MNFLASALGWLAGGASTVRARSERLGRAGAVAIISAVAAPILLMIVGFAIDYGYASYLNQRLARATDSATLGSVSQTAATTAGGYSATAGMQTIGVNIFNASISDLSVTGVSFSLSVVSDGSGGVIATGSYSYRAPTFFAGVIGFNNIPLSGTAKTTAKPVTYVNYYILVDTSQSMGIAATQADMDALYNRVVSYGNSVVNDPGCVFGCHVKQINNGQTQKYTNEDLAHNITQNFGPRINLRIDAAISAIQSIIGSASSIAGATKNIQFALYEIQLDPATNNKLTRVAAMSSDYNALQVAAAQIELGDNNGYGRGDSDLANELSTFNQMLVNNNITSNGNGASSTSPLNYVIIITDGLYDVFVDCGTGTHCTRAIDPANCTALKSKATVGTIYTTYAPIYQGNDVKSGVLQSDFVNLVKKYTMPTDTIAAALQSCATSTDFAFQANDGPDIIAAVQTLFQQTQPSSARITQ